MMAKSKLSAALIAILTLSGGCSSNLTGTDTPPVSGYHATSDVSSPSIRKLIESAVAQTQTARGYTQKYFVIGYPNGDVPIETGACTDLIIRSFRNAGV